LRNPIADARCGPGVVAGGRGEGGTEDNGEPAKSGARPNDQDLSA